ncbi:hypothetical protein BH10ACI3_BH10ACI3_25320 [soil metagenome]
MERRASKADLGSKPWDRALKALQKNSTTDGKLLYHSRAFTLPIAANRSTTAMYFHTFTAIPQNVARATYATPYHAT